MSNLDLSQAVDLAAVLNKEVEDRAKQLPSPQGYRILCAIPEAEEAFESRENMKRFLFCRNSYLNTGNDNN